jgi:hypothetical protein
MPMTSGGGAPRNEQPGTPECSMQAEDMPAWGGAIRLASSTLLHPVPER